MHAYGRKEVASCCWLPSHGKPVNGADATYKQLPSSAQHYSTIAPRSGVVHTVCTIVTREGTLAVQDLQV